MSLLSRLAVQAARAYGVLSSKEQEEQLVQTELQAQLTQAVAVVVVELLQE
jgi:hypothetical protein